MMSNAWAIFFRVLTQLFASVLCFLLLLFGAGWIIAGVFEYWLPRDWQHWQQHYANAVTAGLSLYTGIRLGFHFGNQGRDLPDRWLLKVLRIGFCLALVWAAVLNGAFEWWVKITVAIYPDFWLPDDKLPNYSTAEWGLAFLYCALTYGVIYLFARWCFRNPNAEIEARASALPA